MKIRLKVLTPIHIGSGEEISPVEYLVQDNKFIRINMQTLFEDKEFKPLMDKFIIASQNQRYIGDLLPEELLLKHSLYSLNISSKERFNFINVKSFIKSANRVYIPGSSLKGAILSAVIWKKAKEKRIKNIDKSLIDIIIGEISNRPLHNKFSRWLDVSDSSFRSPSESLELSLVKLVGSENKRQLPILYETLKEGITFDFEIKTSVDSIDKFGKLSEEEILNAVDEFYKKVLQKEKEFKFSQKLPDCKISFLIRIGQGSTCLSTSFLILAEDLGINYKLFRPSIGRRKIPPLYPGEQPQTRKLVNGELSLGWAKIERL